VGALEIDIDGALPLRLADVDARGAGDPGVVEKDVQHAVPLLDVIEEGLETVEVGDVDLEDRPRPMRLR
jgi:hypothetical protein